jgi:hypothetical protein
LLLSDYCAVAVAVLLSRAPCRSEINMERQPRSSSPTKRITYSQCKRSVRGIKNPSHTACHTSSSLQLLYHCFPHLRCALLDLSFILSWEIRCTAENDRAAAEFNDELVYRLSHFYHLLTHGQHAAKPANE